MIQNGSVIHKHSPAINQRGGSACFALLILCFFLGCLGGSLLGSFFQFEFFLRDSFVFGKTEAPGIPMGFLYFIRFQLLAVILGSSYYGLALFPALSFFRGYALSCTAASIIAAYPARGIILAAVAVGLPALFSLPCFFAISIAGYNSSLRILRMVRGQSGPKKGKLFRLVLTCLPVLATGALIEFKLVPYLVSLFK